MGGGEERSASAMVSCRNVAYIEEIKE